METKTFYKTQLALPEESCLWSFSLKFSYDSYYRYLLLLFEEKVGENPLFEGYEYIISKMVFHFKTFLQLGKKSASFWNEIFSLNHPL